MLKYILIGIFVIIGGIAILASTKPDEMHVSRSLAMTASPEKIFAQVNDFHAWEAWSPWAKLDPEAKITFEGPPSGVGALMGWDGNMKVGKGSMTITESRPYEAIKMQLDFEKPLKNTSTAEFKFAPQADQTLVTWTMQGKNNFIGKVISLLFNCEKMIGEQFDKGLANIKAMVEAK